jgi:uncharacterized RmlC-like cupin family protein
VKYENDLRKPNIHQHTDEYSRRLTHKNRPAARDQILQILAQRLPNLQQRLERKVPLLNCRDCLPTQKTNLLGTDGQMTDKSDWKHDGVRVIPADGLDPNTASTPGMERAAAINFARVGAQKLWAGTVHIHANAKTGAHHHGPLESVIYVVRGRARMRWGEKLEFVAEAGPGDFIYVPPFVPHQEINASETEKLECVLVRSDGEAVVVNLDIEPVEKPENVKWIDPIHKA